MFCTVEKASSDCHEAICDTGKTAFGEAWRTSVTMRRGCCRTLLTMRRVPKTMRRRRRIVRAGSGKTGESWVMYPERIYIILLYYLI